MVKKIKVVFYIFWVASMITSLIEAITYSGFFEKHTKLNPIVFVVPTIIFSLILIVLNLVKKSKEFKKNDKIPLVLSGFFLTLYLIFKVIDRLIYANFIFSTLHVQPDNLFFSVLISLLLVIVVWFHRINFKELKTIKSIVIIFIISIIIFNIYKTYKMEWWAFQFIIAHPSASYDDKMRRAVGSEFYDFTQFINKHTSVDSKILIPPQAFPWPQSGNEAFMRYFIYPRKMTNGTEYNPEVKLSDYDYVVLNWGETDSVQSPYTHGWPKFDVPAEKTIFMNNDGSYGGEVKGNFNYKDYINKKVWGLIIIKH